MLHGETSYIQALDKRKENIPGKRQHQGSTLLIIENTDTYWRSLRS
jgi:hypothetical protein